MKKKFTIEKNQVLCNEITSCISKRWIRIQLRNQINILANYKGVGFLLEVITEC